MDPNHKARIAHVKQRIADLVVEQKRDKKICRQPHNVVWNDRCKWFDSDAPLYEVLCRSYNITALLILYHEFRGKDGSHHQSQDKWKQLTISCRVKTLRKDILEKYPEKNEQEEVSLPQRNANPLKFSGIS